MRHDKNLSEELLRQNGIEAGKIPDGERKELQQMIAKDKARVRFAKKAMITSWVLVPLCLLVGGVIEVLWPQLALDHGHAPGAIVVFAVMASYVLILVAIVFTISFLVRSRSASLRQIQASLSDIQQQLEGLAKERGGQNDQ